MNQLTFKQYRQIDVIIWCVLTAVFETVASLASNRWFLLQAMTISISLTMVCLTMMRWNVYALLPSMIGALSFCIASEGQIKEYLVYCGGSFFCLLALPFLKKLGKERVRKNPPFLILFIIILYLSLVLGRWICSLAIEPSFNSLLAFLGTDVLSLLFALLVVFITRNVDGLFEDQKSYLLRLDRERKEAENTSNDLF